MANSVDLVIGSEAIKQVESLISKLSLADAELLKISQTAATVSKGISGISTPSGLDKTVASTTALNTQLEKQNTIITKLHADIAKKAEQSRLAEIKLQQQREKAFDSFEKNAQKEAAIAEKNLNAYNKTQAQINNLTKAYNDLAVRKERYNNLSANEEMRLVTLGKVTEKYNGVLKLTDATIGKNQRNVGNYASGYNALGNSINQLSREAPAFANSINTGFMALSNNIPIFADAIGQLNTQNKILKAEGKPTVSVFKQIVGGLLSWQTALSLGVTLLTIYGGKMVEWIGTMIKGSDATKSLKENQTDLNDAVKEGNKDASKEISQLDILYKTATNVALSTEQRLKAVNKLQETYPSYFADIADEVIMNGKATKSYEALREAIFDSARAKAVQSKLEERASERLDKEMTLREQIADTETRLAKQRANPKAFLGGENNEEIFSANEVTENLVNNLNKRKKELEDYRKSALKEDDLLLQAKEKFEKSSAVLEADRIKEPKERKAKQAKAKREDLAQLESYIKPIADTISQINNEIESLKVIRITGTPEEREEAKKDIETLIELKKQLEGGTPTGGALPNFVVPSEGDAQRTKLKTDWKETFNSIAESAQQAGDIMAEFSQRNFENEYRRLEAQKDISLKFAGDSAEARKKIEEDYQKAHIAIANRENKAKQKQAIFNIAIDTAQAIMATVGKAGFAGIPMAIILGALGAAQIALVASQKVPQYFDGTDNHTGGLMLVNDGAGANYREKIVLPGGKEIIPEGRNVLMNAPKGTKVLTHEQQIMEMLNERGISMSKSYNTNNGMTANEMDAVMAKHFAKIQTNNTTIDRNGFSSWISSNGNKTIQNNNRVSRTGFDV